MKTQEEVEQMLAHILKSLTLLDPDKDTEQYVHHRAQVHALRWVLNYFD